MPQPWISGLCSVLLALSPSSFAQEDRAVVDKSRIPLEAIAVKDFVPPGWAVEEQLSGDLNDDSKPDLVLKLIEEKPPDGGDGAGDRQRALIILFRDQDGKLRRAAVADKLLQCASCGGAFYGTVEAPANVKIDSGVLIVSQDHGSRNVTEQTFRFRYEPGAKKFILIGLDVTDNDRATGVVVEESTNFITGRKSVTRSQYDKRLDKHVIRSTSRRRVARGHITIEEVDYEKY